MSAVDLTTKTKLEIPFDELSINWSFVEMPDEKYVIGMKPAVTGVQKFVEKGGEPVINPSDKKPIYFATHNIIVKLFTMEEYNAQLEMIKRKLMR